MLTEPEQHTLAVATLSITDVIMDAYGAKPPDRILRIKDWCGKCVAQTRARRHPSSQARKAWLFFAEKLDRHGIRKEMSEAERNSRWSALVWTVLTFIEAFTSAVLCTFMANMPAPGATCATMWKSWPVKSARLSLAAMK